MKEWIVACKPTMDSNYKTGGKNTGGLVVYLTDGEDWREVTRVAYARQDSRNPEIPFEDQLQEELEKAGEACDVLNETLDELARVEESQVADAKKRIDEILGKRPAPNKTPA